MTSLEDIRKDPTYQEFCENRDLAEKTKQKYQLALSKYVNLIGMSLESLLEEAEDEEENGIRLRKRKIKKYLLRYKQHLDKLDLSESYKRNLIMCVRTFYNENGIEIPRTFRKKSRKDKKKTVFFEQLPTMEDVKHILKYANSTFRAIILLGVSSGMSRAEICSLTFKDFFDAFNLDPYPETLQELIDRLDQVEDFIPLWQIQRIKTGTSFFTFNSPEASYSIKDYLTDLNLRISKTKETEKIKNEFIFEPEAKLFRNSYLKPMTIYNVTRVYNKLNEEAGFEKVDGKAFIRPHSLRKLFASTLEKYKMPHLMIRWIMGHTIDQTTNSYFKADPETTKDEYLKAVEHLSTSSVKVVVIDRYAEVMEKITDLDVAFDYIKENLDDIPVRSDETSQSNYDKLNVKDKLSLDNKDDFDDLK